MSSKQLYLGLAIVIIMAAAQANAGGGNPLHPSFYWGATPQVQAATSAATLYVDNRNPLHPAYPRVVGDPVWQPAVGSTGPVYRTATIHSIQVFHGQSEQMGRCSVHPFVTIGWKAHG